MLSIILHVIKDSFPNLAAIFTCGIHIDTRMQSISFETHAMEGLAWLHGQMCSGSYRKVRGWPMCFETLTENTWGIASTPLHNMRPKPDGTLPLKSAEVALQQAEASDLALLDTMLLLPINLQLGQSKQEELAAPDSTRP